MGLPALGSLLAKLKAELFVHLADNFPYRKLDQQVAVDIDMEVAGKGRRLLFRKKGVSLSTVYELSVEDSKTLGLSAAPTSDEVEAAIRDLVIALNVCSPRAVFVPSQQIPAENKIFHDGDIEPSVVEKDKAGNVTIRVSEKIRVSDHVSVTLGTKIAVDEDTVLEVFHRIRKTRSDASAGEFIDALERYDEGTSSLNRVTAVQKFAMTMDKLANLGRSKEHQLDGAAVDKEIAHLSGGSSATAEHIRNLYNRTKHAQRDAKDQQFLINALQDIARTVQEAKLMASEAIKAKLPP